MNNPKVLIPEGWRDYELIDSGNFEKLERFGKHIIARPEPQAIWNPSLPAAEWERMADATFRRDSKGGGERGEWNCRKGMPEQWYVEYSHGGMSLKMRLGLTAFKHVGIFPEQANNWNYLYNAIKEIQPKLPAGEKVSVLNLFAYTGGASLAAKCAGADVTHVDSVKQVVSWSRENMEASGLQDIRWIVDDAMKFVKREVKRGKKYHCIVLDPPAYGRGPDGEKWILEEQINELLTECSKLLYDKNCVLILNLYSMGLSALLAKTIVNQLFGERKDEEFGELYVCDRNGKTLPLGVFFRFKD